MMILAILILLLMAPLAHAADLRVVDGDTLVLDGTTYRLHGIDAPEAGQRCNGKNGKPWQCGKKATAFLIGLTEGQAVKCDNRGRDDYDRVIAVCHVAGTGPMGKR